MAIEIFNRQELKFVITRADYEAMKPTFERAMHHDKHNANGRPYALYNMYIDTPDSQLIRHSLDKPVYKEKLRIRSYHPFNVDQPVFLELKKRYKRITNKRRTKIMYDDALSLVTTSQLPALHDYMNHQVVREIQAMCTMRRYEPKVFITYKRQAYVAAGADDDLRVTFDFDLVACRYGKTERAALLPSDRLIMEVKTRHGMPLWLVTLLTQHGIKKQRFSKYGNEYTHFLTTQQQGATHA